MDTLYANGDLTDFIEDSFCVEKAVVEKETMRQLRAALENWKPWANEVLGFYLSGRKHKACSYLKKKYDIPEHQARYRIKLFEKFILKFFKKDYQFLSSKVVVD